MKSAGKEGEIVTNLPPFYYLCNLCLKSGSLIVVHDETGIWNKRISRTN
jgi:hypothetical protein